MNTKEKTLVEIECCYCHSHIHVPKSRYNQSIKSNRRMFCNASCMGKYYSESCSGKNSKKFGSKRTEADKLKHSISRKGKFTGPLNPGWRGGVDKNYPIVFLDIRSTIRESYNNECQICGGLAMDVHHIDYNKKNNDPSNLIVLCRDCHPTTNFNRFFWMSYFKYKTQIAV